MGDNLSLFTRAEVVVDVPVISKGADIVGDGGVVSLDVSDGHGETLVWVHVSHVLNVASHSLDVGGLLGAGAESLSDSRELVSDDLGLSLDQLLVALVGVNGDDGVVDNGIGFSVVGVTGAHVGLEGSLVSVVARVAIGLFPDPAGN